MRVVSLVVLLVATTAVAQDVTNGKDVYGPCAACHGASGEGGKGGEYPRLAGQPAAYLVKQLVLYQTRKRTNLPMFPYTERRELSPADMSDVAAWLAAINLPSKPPTFKDSDSALDRLLAIERVLVVPRVEGDVAKGEALFRKRCAACHGHSGQGHKAFPRLVGQYPAYLERQLQAFARAERPHDDDDADAGVLTKLLPGDFTNILAWLTSIQTAP